MKTGNHILDFMLREGLPLTVRTYIQLETQSDASTRDALDAESLKRLEDLIAMGWLHDEDAEVVQ